MSVAAASPIDVVGVGADGSLGERGREAVRRADVLIGSLRQLELVAPVQTAGQRRPWPSPIEPLVAEIVAGIDGRVCVLASGDPMLHGIGATLARRVGADRLRVHPGVSAFSLACARLGWPAHETALCSIVGAPPEAVVPLLGDGRRIVVYTPGRGGAAQLAEVLMANGFGSSRFVVCEGLGADDERITDTIAAEWGSRDAGPLHLVALQARGRGPRACGRLAGLPDDAFYSDGQLTKWPVRAVTLAALRPAPGELLWDVGAGAGSIAIEWLRAEPLARAVAIERRADRAQRIADNAREHGVLALEIVQGEAPAALDGLEPPDAIFAGGGVADPALLDACWEALAPGARIVANAVTLEGEQALVGARAAHGGDLLKLAVSHVEPIGSLHAWRPQLPIVQWSARR